MTVKFGQSFTVTVSPKLILDIEGRLEKWLLDLAQKESIDVERESMAMAQIIVSAVVQGSSDRS